VLLGNLNGGWFTLSNFAFTFVVLALGELLLPEDKSNVAGEDDVLPELLLFFVVVGQLLAITSLIYGVYTQILSGYGFYWQRFLPVQLRAPWVLLLHTNSSIAKLNSGIF
jgi:hypothetical protein